MAWKLFTGLMLLALGVAWSKWLFERYRENRLKELTEQLLDTLLGFGPEPLGVLFCLIAGCALVLAALTGSQSLSAG
jgi:ABC-type molybdate transport system permease subunit